jgi:hypothetical protein
LGYGSHGAALDFFPSRIFVSCSRSGCTALYRLGDRVVTDPSGAAVPAAKVTLVDQAKGFALTATTDSTGRYLLRSIPPGSYRISAEATNFRGERQEDVKLDVTQNVSIDSSHAALSALPNRRP